MPDDQKESDRFLRDVDQFMKRVDRFIKESDRGPKESDRGPKESDRGASGVVEDVFRQASSLGGFFVVSFIAPVGGSAQASSTGRSARRAFMQLVSGRANGRNQEDDVQKAPLTEEERKKVSEFLKLLSQQSAKPKKS